MDPVTLLWVIFAATVLVVCALDLFVITHRHSAVGVASALRWTGLWIAVALGFGALVYYLHPRGPEISLLFVTGYLTEYSLSVDNLFVFILIFSLMDVRDFAQPKLIKLGILLSIVLRVVFILFGVALVQHFHWLISLFGALLIWTAWKMLTSGEDEHIDPKSNLFYRIAARVFPLYSGDPSTRRLVVRHEGRLCITPLFLVFLVIGSTNVVFALDSIPAIMGISQDPFVVVTSSVFAVLGLGSLFFAIRGVMAMFKFLQHGVSIILFFIGAKMIADLYEPAGHWFKENLFVPLLVIAVVLVVSIVLSVWHNRVYPEEKIQSPNS
ncbi:MAG: TerC/Alx family metal homeostasis membrane protein [Terrimicrobiaceae bacterium]|nr:TerC/Alx family metal homeostasis membrane protein [Terrimicrobiaceae bacterium]